MSQALQCTWPGQKRHQIELLLLGLSTFTVLMLGENLLLVWKIDCMNPCALFSVSKSTISNYGYNTPEYG